MNEILHSDTLKVFSIQAGGVGLWWLDWIPFGMQMFISALTIVFMYYKVRLIRREYHKDQ